MSMARLCTATIDPAAVPATGKSMLKAVREMCNRIVWAWPEDYFGGNGCIVAVVRIEEKCKAGHAIVLYIYEDGLEHVQIMSCQ